MEDFEVSIKVTTGLVVESSCHLADGKAQNGGAHEPWDLTNSILGDAGLEAGCR
ncbi:MAG TPA: hypothetical protein VEJ84_08745 [Acidimicrobiales bacterium]|nr:hypothetical protein [Acidimicrobiales bacterium]